MLPRARSVLAVCAHPDDESFGLGAALHGFAETGAQVTVLCFTHGEASTLGRADASDGPQGAGAGELHEVRAQELHEVRAGELAAAGEALGLHGVRLLDHPDGGLPEVPLERLAHEVDELATECGAELLLVFDEGGVTGHPDHHRATEAALAARCALPVLAWAVPADVATTLNAELGTSFVGRGAAEVDIAVPVDRAVQLRAVDCHVSQARDNPVLRRRLELLGDHESFRWLRRSGGGAAHGDRP